MRIWPRRRRALCAGGGTNSTKIQYALAGDQGPPGARGCGARELRPGLAGRGAEEGQPRLSRPETLRGARCGPWGAGGLAGWGPRLRVQGSPRCSLARSAAAAQQAPAHSSFWSSDFVPGKSPCGPPPDQARPGHCVSPPSQSFSFMAFITVSSLQPSGRVFLPARL